MRHRINFPFRGTSSVLILAASLLLASPLPAAEIEGYTSLDDLPEDAAALPAPPERPWLHHRVTRKKSVQQGNGTPVPAALLPQVQALQARVKTLEQLLSERDGMVADLKTQLSERDGAVADLKSRLAAGEESRAEQAEELLALRRQNPEVSLETEEQQQAYASGVAFAGVVAGSLRMQKSLGVTPLQDTVLAGITDGLRHRVRLNSEQIKTRNQELDSKLNGLLAERREQQENARKTQQKSGEAWQARYRKKTGVREMKNGVLYRVLAAGKGRQIQEGDAVELLLSGYLVDGKAFDDSGEKGRVQRVKPSDLLPALTGVLTTLRAGSHVEVLLPPDQAFGDEGVKGMIPGGATLRFDIRVLKASAGGETKGN
ncbi:FKBP-type peptidyl-prolyl cis-trans isomerase [Salmonella enterica]|nr:FKBP-type peptidyl-prolyl cis-trans isomerase [Salmonella enterica]EIW3704176.1 FKBP-type peptidyl-prolyl cis-trans isomerase [Salmonella enterica]ELX2876550.1 FKBP-type peptidyl-prolyl cis-trans isomerase [Salmonella enterica]